MTRVKSWRLFGVLAFAMTAAICLALPFTDLRSKSGAEFMVHYAVLCALPCLLLAFTASSIAALWPNRATRWLLSNRRYVGLAFAYGMAWHFSFVAYFIASFGNPLDAANLALDLTGLVFLLAMTLTSFRRFSRRLSVENWRRLHKTGIYVQWALPTYFYLDDFVRDRYPFDLVAFGVLFAGLVPRVAARTRQARLVNSPM